jgi:hypothetical protein
VGTVKSKQGRPSRLWCSVWMYRLTLRTPGLGQGRGSVICRWSSRSLGEMWTVPLLDVQAETASGGVRCGIQAPAS